jgi:tetratricopeptide (TPR) repeat protein
VATTLYETADARPLGSQRYDRPDRPDDWNSLIQVITDNVNQATMDAEAEHATREHPDSLDKRDLMFAAMATPLESQISKASCLAQIALIERALALDPNYVWALREGARIHANLVAFGFSSNPDVDLALAAKAADRALLLAPNAVFTLRTKAIVLRLQGDLDGAAALLRKVIGLEPQWGWALRDFGTVLLMQGHYKEALENYLSAKQYILATGADPVALIDRDLAMGLLVNDQFPEAIAAARLALAEIPPESGRIAELPWLALIAAENANGQDAEARADLQKFLATPRTWRTVAEIQKYNYLAASPKLLEGLRRAGMPEE